MALRGESRSDLGYGAPGAESRRGRCDARSLVTRYSDEHGRPAGSSSRAGAVAATAGPDMVRLLTSGPTEIAVQRQVDRCRQARPQRSPPRSPCRWPPSAASARRPGWRSGSAPFPMAAVRHHRAHPAQRRHDLPRYERRTAPQRRRPGPGHPGPVVQTAAVAGYGAGGGGGLLTALTAPLVHVRSPGRRRLRP
jgi:hypothetical protein